MGLSFTERRRTIRILGWPTDVISINPKVDGNSCPDYHFDENNRDLPPSSVHTVLFWVPGNPGQHDWYNSDFIDVLSGLGQGYAIRSISHAGHGLLGKSNRGHGGGDDNSIVDCRSRGKKDGTRYVSPLIPWTVEGQVLHKIACIDSLLSSIAEAKRQHTILTRRRHKHQGQRYCEFVPDLKFIFIGHSFGCHVIQRMCVLRPDILERTSGFLFLMPYIRTKPSFTMDQRKLDIAGSHSELLITIGTKFSQTLRSLPDPIFRSLLRKGLDVGAGEDESIMNVTEKILRNPVYPLNFFELGTEELRDIPNEIDIAALRLLSSYRPSLSQDIEDSDSQHEKPRNELHRRPVFILYANDNDQWCPSFHGDEIKAFQSANLLPPSIKMTKIPALRHDYVCQNRLTRSSVNDWVVSNILEVNKDINSRSNAADGSESHNSANEGFDIGNHKSTIPPLHSKL